MFVALIAYHKTHGKLHKNVNENMFSFTFLWNYSCICNFGIFVRILMKFSQKCRTKKGMIYTILGMGLIFGTKSGLGKSLVHIIAFLFETCSKNGMYFSVTLIEA